jgi:hypothetical protein
LNNVVGWAVTLLPSVNVILTAAAVLVLFPPIKREGSRVTAAMVPSQPLSWIVSPIRTAFAATIIWNPQASSARLAPGVDNQQLGLPTLLICPAMKK